MMPLQFAAVYPASRRPWYKSYVEKALPAEKKNDWTGTAPYLVGNLAVIILSAASSGGHDRFYDYFLYVDMNNSSEETEGRGNTKR